MKKDITIGKASIGSTHKPFIIAEAGINHNGDLTKAFEMIAVAKKAGADAIKFQTFKAREFVTDSSLQFTYKSQGQEVTESMLEMFERYEFRPDQWLALKTKCDHESILFLSTPQNRSDLDLLLNIGIPAIKVGSDDFTNLPLLASYSETGLPLFVSCGMSDLGEIHYSLETIGTFNGYPTVLLLCTSQYPTPPTDVNLRKLTTLAAAFPQAHLGFSDHTQGVLASSIAHALGAVVFEKHFTLDRGLPGPDHWFSEDPQSLEAWVSSIRTSSAMLGTGIVRPTTSEFEMRTLARRSLVSLVDIPRGQRFSVDNLGLRRPGDGLPATFFERVIGLTAARDIAKGTKLQFGDFS